MGFACAFIIAVGAQNAQSNVHSDPIENEIKLSMTDAPSTRTLLDGAGFVLQRDRVFERNVILDTGDGALRRSGRLLRVRQARGDNLITFKGPAAAGRHKSRQEIEFSANSFDDPIKVFAGLGYTAVFHYEKYRTEYRRPEEPGLATLDETPIGIFLELEGPPDWIDQIASNLGFQMESYITSSYGSLYLEHCLRCGLAPGNMEFQAKPVT